MRKVGIDLKTLKSIKLINFQSHKNTLINFAGPGCLTVITGPSDNGKSAVIRALRWVFYNVPQGDGFIFNAEDKCTVTLAYEDGTTVERIRSRGGINRYIVNGKVFEGFGTGVPLEVQLATGIRKLEIGDQSFLLNLSEQLDGPFLGKSVSGPARAKVLGKLAGTEEIDYASKQVGTDISRAKKQKEIFERDIEGLGKQIGRYGFIHSWERAARQADVVLTDTRAKITEIGNLKALMQLWKDLNVRVLALTKVVVGLKEVDKGLDSLWTAQDNLTKGNSLAALRGSHFEAVLESEKAKSTLIRLDPVFRYAAPLIEKIVEQNSMFSRNTTINDSYNQFKLSVLSIRRIVQGLSGIEKAVNHLQKAFNDKVQLSTIEGLHSRHKDSHFSVLSFGRVVGMLVNLEQAEGHLIQAIGDNARELMINDLTVQYERSSLSFLLSGRTVTSYSGIDDVEVRLNQAFQDDIQALGAKKSLEQRVSLAQQISQSLQLFGELTQEINEAESDYLDLVSTLGKCPTCGNDIDIQKLKEAI